MCIMDLYVILLRFAIVILLDKGNMPKNCNKKRKCDFIYTYFPTKDTSELYSGCMNLYMYIVHKLVMHMVFGRGFMQKRDGSSVKAQ